MRGSCCAVLGISICYIVDTIEINMMKRIVLVIIFIFVAVSVLASWYRYYIQYDYVSTYAVPCTPESESCFVSTEECAEGSSVNECATYYSLIKLHNSAPLKCSSDDGTCIKEFCDTDSSGSCVLLICTSQVLDNLEVNDKCSTKYAEQGTE